MVLRSSLTSFDRRVFLRGVVWSELLKHFSEMIKWKWNFFTIINSIPFYSGVLVRICGSDVKIIWLNCGGFCSLVVITSASHAEGRRFESCQKQFRFCVQSYCFSTSSLMDNQLESLCKALDCLFSFLVSDFDYFPLITLLGRVGNFQLYCTVPIVVLSASTMNSRHSWLYTLYARHKKLKDH